MSSLDATAEAPVETQEATPAPVAAAALCANCGAELQGPYCHACGQKAHLHNRLGHLIEEIAEGVAHFDGRFWRTLWPLVTDPGRLSRAWREGRRQRYVAPIAVFLFGLFVLFLTPYVTGSHLITLPGGHGAEGVNVQFQNTDGVPTEAPPVLRSLAAFFAEKSESADLYAYKAETLAYKLSFLIVPISMAILWLLTLGRKGFTLYDHAVVSLYGVGALALLMSLDLVLERFVPALGGLVLLWAGWHAIIHLKGAYGFSWAGAVLRGVALGVLSIAGFTLFLVSVIALGFTL